MAWTGHAWRVGQATDPDITTGAASTATVGSIAPTTGAQGNTITLTVTGTGFVAGSVIYREYEPVATTFVNATTLTCTSFWTTPGNQAAGTMAIGVKNQASEKLSNTVNFTAT